MPCQPASPVSGCPLQGTEYGLKGQWDGWQASSADRKEPGGGSFPLPHNVFYTIKLTGPDGAILMTMSVSKISWNTSLFGNEFHYLGEKSKKMSKIHFCLSLKVIPHKHLSLLFKFYRLPLNVT